MTIHEDIGGLKQEAARGPKASNITVHDISSPALAAPLGQTGRFIFTITEITLNGLMAF